MTPLIATSPEWAAPVAVLATGLVLGWLMLFAARRQERKNFVYERAPRLPIRSLSAHDDAWIRGRVEPDETLTCPFFGTECVYYDYVVEKRVTHTTRDSKGRTTTTTSWRTEDTERDAVPFWLVEEDGGILVDGPRASFEHMPATGFEHSSFGRRHSASLLPARREVSVLGVKTDGGGFGPLAEVPLVVTTRKPADYLEGGDRAAWWKRLFGYVFPFLGGGVAVAVWTGHGHGQPDWVWAAFGGFGALAPVWLLATYNRLVRANQEAEAAWRQVDVDLGVRHSVVPQLVAVVKGYAKHEAELFRRVAELRNPQDVKERIRGEKQERLVAKTLLGLAERYPELKANESFMKLHEQLWALEEKIAASRGFYNEHALEWNNLVEGIPTVFVATVFGWTPREFFAPVS